MDIDVEIIKREEVSISYIGLYGYVWRHMNPKTSDSACTKQRFSRKKKSVRWHAKETDLCD